MYINLQTNTFVFNTDVVSYLLTLKNHVSSNYQVFEQYLQKAKNYIDFSDRCKQSTTAKDWNKKSFIRTMCILCPTQLGITFIRSSSVPFR